MTRAASDVSANIRLATLMDHQCGGSGNLWTVATVKGGTTYLTMVNRGTSAGTVNVDLSGISGVSGGTAVTHPVGPQGADFRYTFPASSLTVLALTTN